MSKYENIPSLKEYVRLKKDKNIDELEKNALEWVKSAHKNRLSYEVEWMGIPVIQTPEDLILMQELIFKVQPDFIVETGIAHGGSLIFYASLFEVLGKGKVIGIDIDIRKHNRVVLESHPLFKRIEMIEGSSTDRKTFDEVKKIIEPGSKVLVCLDSDHTKEHVLKELELYNGLVRPGSYVVVFDTITSLLAEHGVCEEKYIDNSPMEAIRDFLKTNDSFEIDTEYNKLFVSYSPNGYLRRVK